MPGAGADAGVLRPGVDARVAAGPFTGFPSRPVYTGGYDCGDVVMDGAAESCAAPASGG